MTLEEISHSFPPEIIREILLKATVKSLLRFGSIPSPDWVHISAPFSILADEKLLLRFGRQLLVYDSKDGSSLMIKNECNDAFIFVKSLVSPFPPLGLADINDDED
ncbi:hypothetical protein Tco_1075472 [Tanacetum coccineum]